VVVTFFYVKNVANTCSFVGGRIIIMFINCNWAVARWQWLFHLLTKYEAG